MLEHIGVNGMKKLLSIITILTMLIPHASIAKVDKDVNVAKVQAMLAELCYKPGIVDGAWGKKTETAVKAFFAKHYRKYDGNFDVSDANFILSAGASAKAFGSSSLKKWHCQTNLTGKRLILNSG
jgi:peptidoglycan hydrolase-like protein with peptidoglycan-binding domain